MKRKSVILVVLTLTALVVALASTTFLSPQDEWFVEHPMPPIQTDRLFDIGIVDANGDDRLDIYTSNHHFRQSLLLSDGKGGYRDVLSDWGLDQSTEFPLAELSFTPPVIEQPGLYLYWLGTQFIIRAHKVSDPRRWRGALRLNDTVDIMKNEGFSVQKEDQTSATAETVIKFSPGNDGILRVRPGGQGLPITFQLEKSVPLKQIYVGRGKVSPRSNTFSLAMRDRHALAWADYNGDGVLDVFINRGALGGTLRAYPEEISGRITEELLVSKGPGMYTDIVSEAGIDKKDCSARHARWLDFNNDGLLDLFVNCVDRRHIDGSYAKQLYRQNPSGLLNDVSNEVGIDIPDQQIASYAWFDVDDDGYIDLLAFEDDGLFLYRNQGNHFFQEEVLRKPAKETEKVGYSEGNLFIAKTSIADYDADGDIDAFLSSNRGNVLLNNQGGRLSAVDPVSVGLPTQSVTGNWVDYDNDGLPDLHFVPQGLFRQQRNHGFERTKLLELHAAQYHAAICNWFDLDNDGRLDVLMALNEKAFFKRWWEFSKQQQPVVTEGGISFLTGFDAKTYRNIGSGGHWLHIEVVGGNGNRQAIGARVTVVTPDGAQTQEVGGSEGSFFSQGHYRLYFGLGSHSQANSVKVRWPGGLVSELHNVKGDQLKIIRVGDQL